ncbi:tetratricopeptide repeat protein [Flagellimonas nanhaiensis]|uniref:Tetratricopeptide repeat protein n=1 Tax=Flagellimonas nanhaiensis TaxID=2292706 RepID=A0A371JQU9_9FLAO|nr:tetratricopeptide repeat protein [Allomuricauda nanhaiensis]RDY59865.1 tetratricopeptide repeat protein [Allomuricauda nanhaiensis]
MKYFFLIFCVFLTSANSFAQNQIEQISKEACPCIGGISTGIKEKKKFKKIKECISSSILTVQMKNSLLKMTSKVKDTLDHYASSELPDSLQIKDENNIIIEMDKDYDEVEEHLLRNCDAMKTLMASSDVESRNSVSNKKNAKEHYDKGQMFFSEGKYAIAIEHYKNAVEEDSKFAFAWDMIGYSYRKLEEYDKAIHNYEKSLEIDPKGKMPLINIAYAYEYKNDLDNAIKAMNNYIEVYPDEAEGYYGRGRLYHLEGDYEQALDDTMKAYIIYSKMNSPYARDAEHNLGMFYNELKEAGRLEIFETIAKKHNIQIN